ncbi:MAG: hypothetical protein PV340_02000 [Wolbachia sp.]|nr:hypothetical protein [Wolbachia sp.]MDD9336479.1 hypothetical protein [Wolbachia sp.]
MNDHDDLLEYVVRLKDAEAIKKGFVQVVLGEDMEEQLETILYNMGHLKSNVMNFYFPHKIYGSLVIFSLVSTYSKFAM